MNTNELYFNLGESRAVYNCAVLTVLETPCTTPDTKLNKNIFTFNCAEWVNVVPITSAGEIILIEQHRFGTKQLTLETPGGAVEKKETNFMLAALRELEEETGYTSQKLQPLGVFPANPALENNNIHYYLALDIEKMSSISHLENDPFEKIKLHKMPYKEVLKLARNGKINHALCALNLLLAEPFLINLFEKKDGIEK